MQEKSFSDSVQRLDICEALKTKREEAKAAGIPVADDEILEIGTAVGLSGSAALLALPKARLTTIELEEDSYLRAKENFRFFGVEKRVNAYLGDAGDIIASMPREMNGTFGFIFLDGPKAQYLKYLPDLKRLLKTGGVLFSDDVLLYGWWTASRRTSGTC